MSKAEFAKVHVIPTRAQQLLQQNSASLRGCGICPGSSYCWIASGDELLIWNYAQVGDPGCKVLRVPGETNQTLFVQILSYLPSTNINVLACTASGQVYCWLEATYLGKPQTVQLYNANVEPGKVVSSFTAIRVGQGASQAYLAVAAASDEGGSVYILQGSRSGHFVKQLPTHLDGAASSSGVVRLLGNALKTACEFAYAELMNPVYKARRRGPSNQPALNCKIVPHEFNKWKVYVLTYATIDCWLVTIGNASSEELLWSFNLLPVVQGHLKNQQVDILNFDISTKSQTAYIWSAHKTQESEPVKYALHTLPLDTQGVPWPLNTYQLQDEEFDNIVMQDDADLDRWTLVADGARERCLLMFPQGQMAEWDLAKSSIKVLSQDADNLATALCPRGRGVQPSSPSSGVGADPQQSSVPWIVLSAAYGLLEVASPHDTPIKRSRAQDVLTPEMEQAALTALDSALVGRVAMGLRRRLESLGVFEHPANVQVLARYSSTLLNKLPKQWSASGAEVAAVEGSMVSTLKAKQEAHDWLIFCLAKESCLTLIHDLSPITLRTIFENAEKLAATSAVAQLLWPPVEDNSLEPRPSKPPPFMLQIAEQAGQIIRTSQASAGAKGDPAGRVWLAEHSKQLSNWEVAFSYASVAPEAFFQAVEQLATEVKQQIQEDVDVASKLEQLRYAGDIVEEVVMGADGARAAIHRVYSLEPQVRATGPLQDWLYGPKCRAALASCAAVCRIINRYIASPTAETERIQLMRHFTEKLLNAFAAALSFSSLAGAEDAQLQFLVGEYYQACDVCLSSLLDDALTQLRDSPSDAVGKDGLVWVVEGLCAAHHAHAQLFQLCETLSATDPETFEPKLLHHMRALGHRPGGPHHNTFSRFVFEQLYNTGQWARLLELPRTFWPELKEYLTLHPNLLQALLVQMRDYGAAAATMLEEGCLARDSKVRRRMLCLSRMAARASISSHPADPATRQQATAQLQLLNVQRGLGLEDREAMPAMLLAETALRPVATGEEDEDEEGVVTARGLQGVLALRALLAAGPGSKEDARALWRAAWEAVVSGTNWEEMEEVRSSGGDWQAVVEESPLYQAVSCCSRSHLLGYGNEVVDLGELRQVADWIKEWSSDEPTKEKNLLETFEYVLHVTSF